MLANPKDNPAATANTDSIMTFYRWIPDCPAPQRADRSAGGLIPTRAFRYCEPMTAASAFGWYLFPPMDFSVMWDGTGIFWQYGDMDGWAPLDAAQYPGFSNYFDDQCPPEFRGFAPPFISAAPEPGVLKIWSGVIARTAPDWSILVRMPANLPHSQYFDHYEGIIEADRWFGPLFTNLRLTKTGMPITFRREMPLMQVQPLHRSTYSEAVLRNFDFVDGPAGMSDDDWSAYHAIAIAPGSPQQRPRGIYAKNSRKARKS
jgi:hypothetical protein